MQDGDLAVSVHPYYVVILEGVLVKVSEITEPRRFRGDKVTGHNLHWYDLPLRRLATMRRQFPDTGAGIITFTSYEVAELASDFLNEAGIPVDSVSHADFDMWVSLLPFKDGLSGVYDSDTDRLDRYGQYGRQVMLGEDFS